MKELKDMSRTELMSTIYRAEQMVKRFKPLSISRRFSRCGKPGCFCKDGPASGEWGNLHGPYVYARFSEAGKNRRVSLGKLYTEEDIEEVQSRSRLRLDEFLKVPHEVYLKMNADDRQNLLYWCELSDEAFAEKYGISPKDDNFGRDRKFWGTNAQYEAYQSAFRIQVEEYNAVSDELCVVHGIGDVAGQQRLRMLLTNGYYIK